MCKRWRYRGKRKRNTKQRQPDKGGEAKGGRSKGVENVCISWSWQTVSTSVDAASHYCCVCVFTVSVCVDGGQRCRMVFIILPGFSALPTAPNLHHPPTHNHPLRSSFGHFTSPLSQKTLKSPPQFSSTSPRPPLPSPPQSFSLSDAQSKSQLSRGKKALARSDKALGFLSWIFIKFIFLICFGLGGKTAGSIQHLTGLHFELCWSIIGGTGRVFFKGFGGGW